jgi:hypothetical protein
MRKRQTLSCALSSMLAVAGGAAAQTVECAGFETCETFDDWITTYGVWGVDGSDVTSATLGISPVEGTQMLQFVCTSPGTGPPCHNVGGVGGDVHQMIDLAPIQDLVLTGNARLRVEASFNRVAGNAQTDTRFFLRLAAYEGLPVNFQFTTVIAQSSTDLFSDDDPATWERIGACLDLPTSTTYVAVLVSAIENVVDDGTAPEFDGHFADDVALTVLSTCPFDTNLSGAVDVVDLLGLLAAWGGSDPVYDLAPECLPDGVVDVLDLLALLAAWGKCPTAP